MQTPSEKPYTLQVPLPAGFRDVLEAERKRLGLRSWAEVIREKIGCPQPGSDEWDRLVKGEVDDQ